MNTMQNQFPLSRILELAITATIAFAVSWGAFTTKLDAQQDQINELKTNYNAVIEMGKDISSIKTDMSNVKDDVKDLKKAFNVK
jgi:hypothetical protein